MQIPYLLQDIRFERLSKGITGYGRGLGLYGGS